MFLPLLLQLGLHIFMKCLLLALMFVQLAAEGVMAFLPVAFALLVRRLQFIAQPAKGLEFLSLTCVLLAQFVQRLLQRRLFPRRLATELFDLRGSLLLFGFD